MSEKKITLPPEWQEWTVGPLLGRGSFGTVYEIHRDCYGRVERAAMKIITIPRDEGEVEDLYSEGYDRDSITARYQGYLQGILDEYNMMAEMKGCANIVYCDDLKRIRHDNGVGWDIFIKMELLTPFLKTLPEDAKAPVEEARVIRLGMDLCNALVQCKKSNIVHRDIKPQNIFVSKDGTYKLGDFGVAKVAQETTYGTMTGTYRYMAPEVFQCRRYGSSADIYSLGMVMYWMLNGRRLPFLPPHPAMLTAEMEESARQRRFNGEPVPPPLYGSPALKRIVMKACAYHPADRYHAAEEMWNDLMGLQNATVSAHGQAEPVQAPQQPQWTAPQTQWAQPQQPQRVQPPRVQPQQPQWTPPPQQPPRKEKNMAWLIVVLILLIAALLAGGIFWLISSDVIDLSGSNRGEHTAQHRDDDEDEDEDEEETEDPAREDETEDSSDRPNPVTKPTETDPTESVETLPPATEAPTLSPREQAAQIMSPTDSIGAGGVQTVVLRADGTAVAAGDYTYGACNVTGWTDLIAVSSGDYFCVGLRSDGTVVATGDNQNGQCNVSGWRDIVAISAGDFHTVGLRRDGTVVATGRNTDGQCNVSMLNCGKEIIAVAASWDHTAVLYADGTAAAVGNNENGECNITGWRDIVAIYAGANITVGLRSDGTVMAVGKNNYGQCNVSNWRNVVMLSAGDYHTVAITADGQILSTGSNEYGQQNFAGWDNIVAIGAGCFHTVAITSDGRILSTGRNHKGQCEISQYSYYH